MCNKIVYFLILVLVKGISTYAQTPQEYSGTIKDKVSKKELHGVVVELEGKATSTVTNQDGTFLLKVQSGSDDTLRFSLLGYDFLKVPISKFKESSRNTFLLSPHNADKDDAIPISAVEVLPNKALEILERAMSNVPQNYLDKPIGMIGFYREAILKNSRYVSVNEAVLEVAKTSYTSAGEDYAKILKGRSLVDNKRIDTIFVKYKGGVESTISADIVKDIKNFFYFPLTQHYDFSLLEPQMMNGRKIYVVGFAVKSQYKNYNIPRGEVFVDAQNYAIIKIHFTFDISKRQDPTHLFISRKPFGMKINLKEVNFEVNYREYDGKYYYHYFRSQMVFRCKWDKRLFASKYTIVSEMAITDHHIETYKRIPYKERVKSSDILNEQIQNFTDVNFWEAYNIIDPESSMTQAVEKIVKQLKKE